MPCIFSWTSQVPHAGCGPSLAPLAFRTLWGLRATVPAALDSGWTWGRTGWVHVSATPLISGGLVRLLSALHLGVPRRSWRPHGCLSSSLSGDPCLWAPAGQALSRTDGRAKPASPFAFCLLWAGRSLQRHHPREGLSNHMAAVRTTLRGERKVLQERKLLRHLLVAFL